MRKHLQNNWGWYGLGIFQSIIIFLKAVGALPNVSWWGAFAITEVMIVGFFILFLWLLFAARKDIHKSPKE